MKNKNFIIVVAGQIISLFGNAVVFSRTLAMSTIPYILFASIAGLLADTVNRKNNDLP